MTETISPAQIDQVKRDFLLRNTLLDVVKVSEILSCSVKTVYRLIDEGDLERAPVRNGNRATRVTALSVEIYVTRITGRAVQG